MTPRCCLSAEWSLARRMFCWRPGTTLPSLRLCPVTQKRKNNSFTLLKGGWHLTVDHSHDWPWAQLTGPSQTTACRDSLPAGKMGGGGNAENSFWQNKTVWNYSRISLKCPRYLGGWKMRKDAQHGDGFAAHEFPLDRIRYHSHKVLKQRRDHHACHKRVGIDILLDLLRGKLEMGQSATWTTMDHHGPPWTTMDHHGPPWTPKDHHGPPRTTMDPHGPPWTTMDPHGPPRTTMDPHGPPWTTKDQPHQKPTATIRMRKRNVMVRMDWFVVTAIVCLRKTNNFCKKR